MLKINLKFARGDYMPRHSSIDQTENNPNEYKGRDGFNAHDQTEVKITARDRVMRAWEDCMEHARDYKKFAVIYGNSEVGELFKEVAEYQGVCAAKMHDMLLKLQKK